MTCRQIVEQEFRDFPRPVNTGIQVSWSFGSLTLFYEGLYVHTTYESHGGAVGIPETVVRQMCADLKALISNPVQPAPVAELAQTTTHGPTDPEREPYPSLDHSAAGHPEPVLSGGAPDGGDDR